MTTKFRTILTTSIILAVALLTVSAASASTLRAQVDGTIVIGDQVFEGGEIQLTPVGAFLAVRIDGRQVALVYRPDRGRDAVSAVLTFTRDERGFYHLRGLRYVSDRSADASFEPLRFATVAKGDAPADVTEGIVQTARAAR